ncbi:MAG: cupin domain-containing protein [Micrococcales bacterium]|nr:cupin domain-containing protein [Micrococcales bacterium]OJX69748.1 MAG: hypothetical protein BGO94_14865 [Micrococcales bacterium 72-143]
MLIQRRGDEHHDWALYRGDGRVGIDWYFREASALPTSVMLYHLEPGTSEGEHFHLEDDPESCSVETQHELYLVISGEVVMTVGGERTVLTAGDAVYVPEGVPHGVANETDAPAELILLFGEPTGQTPYTVNTRAAVNAPAGRPRTPEA